jgi:predicted RNase H-like nuclease
MVIAVDIPIGLWEKGDRECDNAARALVGPGRRSSVFPPPPRYALKAKDYDEAKRLSIEASGKSLSKQTFAIMGKIREVDEWITPRRQKRVYEVHPEVSFWALNGCVLLNYSKKSPEGREERLRLLRPHFKGIEDLLKGIDGRTAAADDMIDAAAALWTARRIASGKDFRLTSYRRDSKGLRMEIVY